MKGVISLFCALWFTVGALQADQRIIQIGGGNRIDNSQGQIEDNVIWLSKILKKSSSDVANFFAAGNGGVKDVSLYGGPREGSPMDVLARVFDGRDASRLAFKSNDVPDLSGSMRKDEILSSLSVLLDKAEPGRDILLIYNGHGGNDDDDVRLNTLKVWGDERLTVPEMDKILDRAPGNATVRFIFPQCYSGAFYYLIFEDPYSDKLSGQTRCGFFSESAYEQSEGCALSTNKDEYRDYSTYFFAPLNGETRSGSALPVSADRNQDGVVSYRESHLYALMVGESKDLSRSSSEMYLESWVPWYLRWESVENRESEYWKIAEYVAQKHALSMDGKVLGKLKKQLQGSIDSVMMRQKEYLTKLAKLSSEIKDEIVLKWPEVLHPYTKSYIDLINGNLKEIVADVERLPAYSELVELQDALARLNQEELGLQRDKAQIDKILRLKNLARLERRFERFAGDREKQAYRRLLDCEKGAFFRL